VNLGAEASRSPAFYADLIRSREILSGALAANIAGAQPGDSITVSGLYRITGSTPEQRLDEGIKELRRRITLAVDQRTNVVRVTIEAPRAAAARDVLQLLLDRLADFNIHTRQTTAGERRKFIEGRVASSERQLQSAEEALRAFYEKNRQWQSSPQLRFEEQRLNRQVAVQQELYLTLRREYETARIEEVNNTPLLTIIDHPAVPGRRIRPQRMITVLLVTFVVAILASTLALILEHHQDLLASGDPEYVRLYERVRGILGRSSSHA
jgi:capsule polysaccharide export protein KpsE/RkpR